MLLLATVLPFSAQVYEGRLGSRWGRAAKRPPTDPLLLEATADSPSAFFSQVSRAIIADIWVAFFHSRQQSSCGQAAAFLEAILRRQPGLQLERWTRLPYNGDAFSICGASRLDNPKSITIAGMFPPVTMSGLTTPWTWLCWRCASRGAQATRQLLSRPRHPSASSRGAGRSQRSARRSEGATAFTASWQVRWRARATKRL